MSRSDSTLVCVEEKLQDAATSQNLSRLLDRLDEVLALLDLVGEGLKRGPEYADNINGLVSKVRDLSHQGGLEELAQTVRRLERISRSKSLLMLEEKILDENIADSILELLNHLDEVSDLVTMVLQALKRGPEYADNLNGLLQKLRAAAVSSGDSLEAQIKAIDLPTLRNTAFQLTQIIQSPQMQNLLASEIFGKESVELVDRVAKIAVQSSIEAKQPGKRIGIFDLFRALNDPDIQTTLRFALGFAKKLGRELSEQERISIEASKQSK